MTIRRDTNLVMTFVDYKKAYDMVSNSWILGSLELVQVSHIELVKRSMRFWQTELNTCRESLVKVNTMRGIFQSENLSPFAICDKHVTAISMYYAKPRQDTP